MRIKGNKTYKGFTLHTKTAQWVIVITKEHVVAFPLVFLRLSLCVSQAGFELEILLFYIPRL